MNSSDVTKVKICGITNRDDALAACDAGADAIGFVFAQEGKRNNRYIDPDAARKVVEVLPPFVTTVAVAVNDSIERLCEYLTFVDRVQLHGDEDPDLCRELGGRAIKAFRAGPEFRTDLLRHYPACAYLFDACMPGARGGTGKTCDWTAAEAAVQSGFRIILAGGLTPENVTEAVRRVRPYAVDASGGVERAPGKKDHERVRIFIHRAKISLA